MSQQDKTPDCPCTSKCRKHGNCRECVAYHRKVRSLPICFRDMEKKAPAPKSPTP